MGVKKIYNYFLKLKQYKRAFKVDLITCFIGLIIFTIGIVIYNAETNSKSTLVLAKELVNNATEHAVSETTHYLKIAQEIPFFTATLLSGHKLNLLKSGILEQYLMQVLKNNSELFMYYIGDEKGNFIMSYRNKYKNISTQLINRETRKPVATLTFRDSTGNVYAKKQQFKVLYDPRNRPWYVNAKQTLKPYWTEIYNFYADDLEDIYKENNAQKTLFGFTISNPIFNAENKLVGVIGVDITLNQLSDFLSSLKIGTHGKAFIINNEKQLILFPNISDKQLADSEKYQEMQVENISLDWLKVGMQQVLKNKQKEFFYSFKGDDYFVKVHDLSIETGKSWDLIIIVPVDDFLAEVKKARQVSFLITAFMLLLSVLFSLLLSRTLSRPLEKMTLTMRKINELDFVELNHLSSSIREFQQMADALTSMTQGLKAFLKYVPSGVVKQLIKKGETISLGGHELDMTIFFSDIENFTEIAENTAPLELMEDLSYYFDQMVKVIVSNNHGTIDKYIGDSVMAFWGAPNYTADHARLSCLAALSCQYEIEKINAQRVNQRKKPFNTRIGINTGLVIVGNIGSSDRYNYTAIGDDVNLASRIEGLNKLYKTNIMVSQSTYRRVHQFFVFRPLDFILVKGKNEGIKVYQLLAKKDQCDADTLQLVEQTTQAFNYYLDKKFIQALKLYLQTLARHPQDAPAKIMIEKCQHFIENPPDKNWTGATRN